MSSTEQGFQGQADRVADHEREIQQRIDAKEQRSFKSDGEDEAPPQTGAREYPAPPLPGQHLEKPGLEAELDLKPMYDAPFYKGSGKLEGKVLPAGVPRSTALAGGAKTLSTLARKLGMNWIRGKVKTNRTIRNILYRPYGDDKPKMSPETERRLREIFKPELELADKVAGTDLAARWNR